MKQPGNEAMLTGLGVREYFQEAVQSALCNQQFNASGEAVIYVVNLLAGYVRSENLFEHTPDGFMLKPLAFIYGDALTASTETDRTQSMQRLGDVSLFISGFYANGLGRCLVDVDYYIAMGGNAYSYLAEKSGYPHGQSGLKFVFDELSGKFAGFVEILAEVCDKSNMNDHLDILRLYEIWQCTGSRRVEKKLRKLGIDPVKIQRRPH